MLMNPVKTWEKVGTDTVSVKRINNSILIPLIIIVSFATFLGSLLFTNAELLPVYSVFEGVKQFIILYSSVYLTSYIFVEITFPLDLGRDFKKSFKIIVFSMVPFLLCKILSGLFESLQFINIIGFYGLIIFWAGADKMMKPPQYKKMPMLIATLVTITGIYVAMTLLFNMLTDKIYYAFFD
jgi:hypothetical protein